ncbi:MAG: PilZ domain-containing protein [Candidatus Omnitrophica bacterium]|nr:PilZ domain-containing protein [Candidatus Omnitrophota bacterium]
MPEGNRTEKREFVRFLIAIPLKYAKMGIKVINDSSVCNISARGLGLIAAEELPVSSPIDVCLKIPDNGQEIPLEAEVVWSKPLGASKHIYGLSLKNAQIKPIPLVLRTIQSRL